MTCPTQIIGLTSLPKFISFTGAKGSQQTNKKTKKGFKQKEQKTTQRQPWSGAPDCPVHQGTRLRTCHLREFWEPLRYNSPDCPVKHRTVRCHTGLSGVPAEQQLLRAQRSTATHLIRACARRGQSTRRWRTGQSIGPVRCTTGQPRGPTCQSSNGQNPTAG